MEPKISKGTTQNGLESSPKNDYGQTLSRDSQVEHDLNKRAVLLKVTKLEEDTGRRNYVLGSVEKKEYCIEKQPQAGISHASGLGVWVTAVFIFGEMVGTGVVLIPNAMCRQGWYGIATLVVGGAASGYTGAQLGWCWTILQERWPNLYLKHTRKPYPEMGYQVGGRIVKTLVSFCIDFTLFGASCGFLILAAENASSLVEAWFGYRLTFCVWILIIGACLTPLIFLGSPKDFWPAALGASAATVVAIVLILIGTANDYSTYKPVATYPTPTLVNFILGYGAVIFAYGGHSAFPTIQHDMKNPAQFPKAVFWAYIGIFVLYVPLGLFTYVVYGARLADDSSILNIIPGGWTRQVATLLITIHVVLAFVIVSNPVNQEIEHLFKIPTNFTWKRALLRTVYACLVVFASESLPSFGMILGIVGGTTIAAMTFIFPGWFYLALRYHTRTPTSNCDIPIRWWEWPLNVAVVAVGALGGGASIYAGVMTVVENGDLFKLPCYVNAG